MSRTSVDEVVEGIVKNGFDYKLQVWVKDYKIVLAGSTEKTAELKGKDIREMSHEIRKDN